MEVIKRNFTLKSNATGNLVFLEAMRDVPFEIKRIYYIYGVGRDDRRGFHAHRKLEQYLICVNGSCEILLDDGYEKRTVLLNKPNEGLYISSDIWREMYNFSPDAVLLVLASDYYDEDDYIRNYDDFIAHIRRIQK